MLSKEDMERLQELYHSRADLLDFPELAEEMFEAIGPLIDRVRELETISYVLKDHNKKHLQELVERGVRIKALTARVSELEEALEWFADEGHYTVTYRAGAGYADVHGLGVARAALLGIDDDDVDEVERQWSARTALEAK